MSDTPIQPGSASVNVAGLAAAMAASLVMVPGTGSWSAASSAASLTSGTATVIAPPVGAAALAGAAPTVTQRTSTVMTPTVGALALAGVASTVAQHIGSVAQQEGPGQWTVTWSGIGVQPGRAAPPAPGYETVFAQVTGTFGTGGSIQLEGSNDRVNWVKLSPAALTSAGFFAALGTNERPKFVRPNVTGGDATTSLNVVAWFTS